MEAATQPSDDGVHARATISLNAPKRRKGKVQTLARHKSFDDLPDYLRDNEYIVGFYRAEQPTVWGSVKTLFSLHNETGNVWSHLLGFLLFACLACYVATHPPTPLAVTAEHLDHLLHELVHELHGLHLGERAHALGHSLHDCVASLEGTLAHALSCGGGGAGAGAGGAQLLHRVAGNLQSVSSSLAGNLHSLGGQLQHGLHVAEHAVGRGLHAVEASIHTKAAHLQGALAQQLRPIVQWPTPRWPVYVYFAGACVCLLTSGVCHLLGCCKQHIAEMVWRFDYAGIAALIVASFVPAMYYAFLCSAFWRNFYLLTTVSMGCVVVGMSLPTVFQARQYRVMRAVIFTLLGAWGVVPVTHLLLSHGHVWAIRTAFRLDLLMGAIYVVGATIYACRVPERWYPGKFDVWGHSHQLWHAAVVLAAWVHYCAIMLLLQWRDAAGGCAAPGIVNGPVHEVLQQLQQQGKAPLQAHQVHAIHASISQQLARYAAATGAAAAAGAGGGGAGGLAAAMMQQQQQPVHMDL